MESIPIWPPFLLDAAVIGVGATLFMDVCAKVRSAAFGAPSLDYALVGRWFGHMAHGKFLHAPISASPPIAGEAVLGWAAHYALGIAFAAILLAIWGLNWARDPSLLPALIVGVSTVLLPFLVLQPAFGAGIASSRTPRPNLARMRSVISHLTFGVGLYLAALARSLL